MKSLLWREYRFNGPILLAGVALLLLPYVFTVIALLWPSPVKDDGMKVTGFFTLAAVSSYSMSQLTVALLGGNAFAGERADRSAEFMAYLPIARERRLVSKLILALLVSAIIWGINLLFLWGLMHSTGSTVSQVFDDSIGYTALTGFVAFGVAWMISSFQSSPTFAVGGGIATPIATMIGLQLFLHVLDRIDPEALDTLDYQRYIGTGYATISLILGTLGFAVGTWYYLKRVEP